MERGLVIGSAFFSLHCLSAFRAFPAFPSCRRSFGSDEEVFIAFRRSGRSPPTQANTVGATTIGSSLPFGVQGVPRSYTRAKKDLGSFIVFIAFRRSGRSPQKTKDKDYEKYQIRSSLPFGVQGVPRVPPISVTPISVQRLHCLSAFRAFPAPFRRSPFRRSKFRLHCLSAFRAFPALCPLVHPH